MHCCIKRASDGYDDNAMPNGILLNRDDLDKAFPKNPVIVLHVSMHGCVLNSGAMKKFGINASTKTVEGGIIVRKPGTNEPYGLIMEMAFLPVLSALPQPTPEQQVEFLRVLVDEGFIRRLAVQAVHAHPRRQRARRCRPPDRFSHVKHRFP